MCNDTTVPQFSLSVSLFTIAFVTYFSSLDGIIIYIINNITSIFGPNLALLAAPGVTRSANIHSIPSSSSSSL